MYLPLRQQIPARRNERVAGHPAAVVQRLQRARRGVVEDLAPDQVAVAADDRVALALLAGFVRIQRRVNAAVNDRGAGRAAALPTS